MIWNPWRRIRELEALLARAINERDALGAELSRSCDRYDKIREANLQLRDALSLYRSA